MSETSPLEVHVLASGSKGNCTVIKKEILLYYMMWVLVAGASLMG